MFYSAYSLENPSKVSASGRAGPETSGVKAFTVTAMKICGTETLLNAKDCLLRNKEANILACVAFSVLN